MSRLYILQGSIGTDGTNTGTCSVTIDVPVGTRAQILYGELSHDDAGSRQIDVAIRTPGNATLTRLLEESLTSGARRFPGFLNSGVASNPPDLTVVGNCDILMRVLSMAINSTFTFAICILFEGADMLTATLLGPTGSTDTTNEEIAI